ncbi:butyrophilin-like protein 2 isoform X2 [Ictalurus punctatus]|uniref:Butyrophilin-like protein 2 isoform X2 n=1 Tax=Ictalurus punctatus TaxID=7998 RepID=A0A9F7R320_ICTPU|nr:butyrophilin-like protein 2 isoform X2 [Ictalurus punctatus]
MANASNNEFKLIGPSDKEFYNPSAVTLSCRLSPEISAVNMEIRWFKVTDCVCVYKNRHVTEGRGYEGRVSLFTQELERGNISLQLRDCTGSELRHYMCQVTDGDRTEELTVMMGASTWLQLKKSSLGCSISQAWVNIYVISWLIWLLLYCLYVKALLERLCPSPV